MMTLAFDMNGDGSFTIGDLWAGLTYLLFLPGDLVLSLLVDYAPAVAEFLELSTADYGSPLSKFVSVAAWLAVFIVSGVIVNTIRNLDRAMTTYISGRYEEFKRRLRIIRRRLTSFVGMIRQRRLARAQEIVVEGIALEGFDTAVLRCHASIDDYKLLAAEDVAATLNVPLLRVQKALRRLSELHLLERSLGTDEGRDGHHITQAGQIYLIDS